MNISKLVKHKTKLLIKIISLYDEYMKLAKDELNDAGLIAYNHGWRSTRYEQGQKLRNDIDKLKHKVDPTYTVKETK